MEQMGKEIHGNPSFRGSIREHVVFFGEGLSTNFQVNQP